MEFPGIQKTLEALYKIKESPLLNDLWAAETAKSCVSLRNVVIITLISVYYSNVRLTLATLFSSTFHTFVSAVSDFIASIQQQLVPLETIERFLRPLVEPDAHSLEECCQDALWLTNSFSKSSYRKIKIADLMHGFHSVSQYLKFLAVKDVISELLESAR